MKRLVLAVCLLAAPLAAAAAETKEQSCAYQGQVVAAIQKARLDRVRESKVAETIAASNPTWPENYNAAIPQLTAWVYEQKMRKLRKVDLGSEMQQQCLQNWDQIQQMKKTLKN